jgi:hypothetical protein
MQIFRDFSKKLDIRLQERLNFIPELASMDK